jgi:hypothetical protein
MHKSEKTITTKINVTHKLFDENTICFDQIIDQLSSYTPTSFQQKISTTFFKEIFPLI